MHWAQKSPQHDLDSEVDIGPFKGWSRGGNEWNIMLSSTDDKYGVFYIPCSLFYFLKRICSY